MNSQLKQERSDAGWSVVAGVALAYFLIARLSLLLAFEKGIASPVWPPSGLAFAVVLIWGYRVWPGVALGALAANVSVLSGTEGATPAIVAFSSSCIAIGNTTEAILGAALFRRLIGKVAAFSQARDVFAFSAIALAICLTASTIGPTSAWLAGLLPSDKLAATWFTWWIGDFAGVLIVAPLFFQSREDQANTAGSRSLLEAGTVLAMLTLVCLLLFGRFASHSTTASLDYLLIPILLWIACRYRRFAAAAALAAVAIFVTIATAQNRGPFAGMSLNNSLLLVQGFICVVAVTVNVVAASQFDQRQARADRNRAIDDLKRAKESAEATSRAKSVFLANLSHEIRTPLTAILAAAELSADPQSSDRPAERYRELVMRNGKHLHGLVNELLDMARMDAGKIDLILRRCSLVDVIANVSAATTMLPRNSCVNLSFHYETDIPEFIQTDPTRLTQVLINLVNNALKFTEEGHVHVSISVLRDAPDPRLIIHIEDTGVGIPKADLDRVFEGFTQLAHGNADIAAGAGLGLPLARGISEQLGGRLTVDSILGKGSTFTMQVPTGNLDDARWIPSPSIHDARTLSAETPTFPKTRLHASILLAEDFRDTRDLFRLALESAGATVTAVENGHKAIVAASNHQFDLIILDIRMPQVDGCEAARVIRSNGFLAPIVALTASIASDLHDRLFAAGFDDVWSKPITLADLIGQVSTYTKSSTPNSGATPDSPMPVNGRTPSDLQRQLSKLRDSYVDGLATKVTALRNAASNGDRARLGELLHQIVGSAGIHGLKALSDESARLLVLAKSGDLDGNPSLLENFADITRAAYSTR